MLLVQGHLFKQVIGKYAEFVRASFHIRQDNFKSVLEWSSCHLTLAGTVHSAIQVELTACK